MSAGNQLPKLDKIFKEDDEADFLPSSGANLAAIFGLQNKTPDGQVSGKQQIHKKAQKSALTQPAQVSKTEVIIAKPVYAFKLKNDTYQPLGKLGMALTGNVAQKSYQIILYKSKQEHISVASVVPDFMYTVQENNYSSYYDNMNENWSILFESLDVSIEFAREIGMARYLARKDGRDDILYQDLTSVAKDVIAKEGDNVSIKYFITTEIVQPFKHNCTISQTMMVEISTDNNWERVLLGTTKGLRRILFLPPSKQISLGPGFPKDRNIMLEVEIMDIKMSEEKSDTVGTGSSNKANILSRMAKVGQSMLPKIPTVTSTDSEDTEDDLPQKSPQQKKEPLGVVLQKRNIIQEHSEELSKSLQKPLQPTGESVNVCPSGPIATTVQPNYGQLSTLQQQAIPLAIPTMMDQSLNLMLSETRMANTELRMGMYKIADNVQKLLDKFHTLELQNASSPMADKITMDATLKMLLAMNVSGVEKKANDLLKESSETNNVLPVNTIEISDLKHEIVELKTQLKEITGRLMEKENSIQNVEIEKQSLLIINQNLEERIKQLQESLDSAKEILIKTQQDMQDIKNFNSKYHEMVIEVRDTVSKIDTSTAPSENTVDTLVERDKDAKNKEIKCIMNKTYQTLLEKFEDESYSADYIKSTIASTIKNITLLVLGENQETFEKETEQTDDTKDDVHKYNEEMDYKKTPESIVINDLPTIQDEPPPIPPNDTEMESD